MMAFHWSPCRLQSLGRWVTRKFRLLGIPFGALTGIATILLGRNPWDGVERIPHCEEIYYFALERLQKPTVRMLRMSSQHPLSELCLGSSLPAPPLCVLRQKLLALCFQQSWSGKPWTTLASPCTTCQSLFPRVWGVRRRLAVVRPPVSWQSLLCLPCFASVLRLRPPACLITLSEL